MAKVFIEESTLVGISDSIRAKTGKTGLIKPGQWAAELDDIKSSGKYLWSRKGMADSYTTTSGSATKTLVTANSSIAEVELEYSSSEPHYNTDKGIWEFINSSIVTIINTDDVLLPGYSNYSDPIMTYVRLTSEPNVWYIVNGMTVGNVSALNTYTKSMTYTHKYAAEIGSDILGYTVSDDFSAYPDGGWQDGYYYEVVGGLIEFTIAGTHYYADEGMNWGDWIKSDFNTAGYTNATISGIASPSGTIQSIDDVIIDGLAYVWD